MTIFSLVAIFSQFWTSFYSLSGSNCCFLTCIQVSQDAGQVVWYSHLLRNFPHFVLLHTANGFSIVNEAEVGIFPEFSCFFYDSMDVGNLISGSSAFSKSSLNIWKFSVHILLKPSLEKAMATHSSTLAWKIPWTEEPGRLQSTGSLRVGHDWATLLSLFTFMHWRRKWQPTPVFLPGESQGQRSLVGCHLWGRTESDTTEVT